MKKIFTYIAAAAAICMGLSSCWKENLPETGPDRHEVCGLEAVSGDEEVVLKWSLPEGWNADSFIISYKDAESKTVKLEIPASECQAGTDALEYVYTLKQLVNDVAYNFSVQAVYAGNISGELVVSVTPRTTRIAVRDLSSTTGNARIVLAWTKPSETLTGYTLSYYPDGKPEQKKDIAVGADQTGYEITGLENDVVYVVILVANYANGQSQEATLKAMPSSAIVYFLSQETAAKYQPITFRFNTGDFPTATNIKWTFPDGKVLSGAEVRYGIGSVGLQKVMLSATVDGVDKSWPIEVTIREYVVYFTEMGGNGEGFKANVPVFSPDHKTVYSITYNTNATLFAWDIPTGELKWKYATGNKAYNGATVNPVNGDIYCGTTTAGNFFCLNPDGTLKWKFTGAQSMQSAFPTTNAAGTVVYLCDNAGNAFALNAADGSQIWKAAMGKQAGGILVCGDEILFGLNTGGRATLVWVKASDGTDVKTISQATGMTEISGFAVSADKKYAYYGNKGGSISKLNLETKELVVDSKKIADNDLYEPCVSPNGDVFIGSKDSYAYCLDGNLSDVKWKLSVPGLDYPANNAFNYSHPSSDTNGNFYISSGQIQCWNFIVGPDGAMKESWQYGASSADRVMAGTNLCDGVYYTPLFNSGNTASIFVGRYVGGYRYDGHGTDLCGNCILK